MAQGAFSVRFSGQPTLKGLKLAKRLEGAARVIHEVYCDHTATVPHLHGWYACIPSDGPSDGRTQASPRHTQENGISISNMDTYFMQNTSSHTSMALKHSYPMTHEQTSTSAIQLVRQSR